jgi:hypothetical protein
MADEDIYTPEEEEEFTTEKLPETPTEEIFYREEYYKVVRELLEDPEFKKAYEKFPEEVKKLWVENCRNLITTFFDARDVSELENLFEALICKFCRKLPPRYQTAEIYLILDQLRIMFKALIRRSFGSYEGKINERMAILAQLHFNVPFGQQQKQGGIFSRIFRRE